MKMSGRHSKKRKRRYPLQQRAPAAADAIQTIKDTAKTQPAQAPEERNHRADDRVNWNKVAKPDPFDVAVWGLLVAFAVAVVYFFQLRAMQESNKINREALESVQRAFVAFSPSAEVGTTVDQNRKVIAWQAHVPMKNTGSTGTKRLRDNISFYTSKTPLPESFTFPDTSEVIAGVLGPKDEIQLRTNNIPIGDVILTPQALAHIYVYGWAAYRDVFPHSTPHLTMFCYELFPNTIPGDLTSIDYKLTGSFLSCKRHNCQDEECRDEVLPTGVELPN